MRGGLRGFYVFIACIALGVMAIAGVGSVSASLSDGLAREGRTLLGGDVSFVLFQREAKPEEVAFLRSRGTVSSAATLRGMARAADGQLALVEMKAVDDTYPMLGQLTLAPPLPMSDLLAERDGAFGAAADPTLLARLSLKTGDRVTVGAATFQIRSTVEAEPDKLAGGIGFGPRFLISEAGLRATGLVQPGSLVRWVYRVKLPEIANSERATDAFIADARNAAPQAGWEVRSRSNASPQLERNINRFTQFLTLVGLAALLVGGVGVANAVKSPYRPQARGDRGLQGRRRHRARRVRHLSRAGSPARRDRLGDRPCARRRHAVRRSSACSASCCRCRWCRPCMPTSSRCRSSTACSRRSPSACGRSGACTTCRSPRCSATPSAPNGIGHAGAISSSWPS